MSSFSLRKQDPVLFTGLTAVPISFGFSLVIEFFRIGDTVAGSGGSYAFSIMIAVGYFIVLLVSGRLKKGRNGFFPFLLLLVLFFNGAYAMNRECKWFEIPTGWYCLLLTLICGNHIAIGIFSRIPAWLRFSLVAIAGAGICFLMTIGTNNIL